MPSDANVVWQASTTKTATFNGAAVTVFPTGTPRWHDGVVRVIYSANSANTGGDTLTFSVDESTDAGSTFKTIAQALPLAQPTSANSGELFIPFQATKGTAATNDLQFRLSVTFSSTAHANTITYQGDGVFSIP